MPAADRKAARTALTVADLATRFDREHISIRLKPNTAREYRRNLRRFILPALGKLKVQDVTRADIAKFHHDLRHIPYQANRNLEVISKMFNLAELWGQRPDGSNPRRHIKRYPEEKRERYLTTVELARLGEVLRQVEQEGIETASAKWVILRTSRPTHLSAEICRMACVAIFNKEEKGTSPWRLEDSLVH